MQRTRERGIGGSRLIEGASFTRKSLEREQERRRWRPKEVAKLATTLPYLGEFPKSMVIDLCTSAIEQCHPSVSIHLTEGRGRKGGGGGKERRNKGLKANEERV